MEMYSRLDITMKCRTMLCEKIEEKYCTELFKYSIILFRKLYKAQNAGTAYCDL